MRLSLFLLRLQELLSTKLKAGWSPKALLAKIEMCAEKLYLPHSTNKEALDLALLIKSFGGNKLLYAAQKASGSVSRETLRRCV